MTDERFQNAAAAVREAVQSRAIPSAALAIGVKDRVYVREALGVTSYTPAGEPADAHTLYDMASMTKIMATGMIALRLLETGTLDLNDRLARYFGAAVPEDKQPITIFRLMTHTAGLPAYLRLDKKAASPEEAVPVILRTPLEAPIGTRVIYSCMGFILLGRILEHILGAPLDTLARAMVFEPLGMTATGYHPLRGGRLIDPAQAAHAAFTERDPATGEWLRGVVHDENARFLAGVSGNAGVFSNLQDGIKYARMLACGGVTPAGRFLAPSTLRAAARNYTPGMDENRGLAFHLANGYEGYTGAFADPNSFGHTGFTGTHLMVSPDSGLFVLLLTNRVHPTRENNPLLRLRRVVDTAAASALPL